MLWMKTRQATKLRMKLLTFLALITACSPANQLVLTPSPIPPTSTPKATAPPQPPTETPAVAPLACLTQGGRLDEGALESTSPAQEYLVYLPPCYEDKPDLRYPVLYLLHGQTYTDDQWVRIGAVDVADRLIASGESQPFIIVLPDDHYWNLPAGTGFGQRLVGQLIPHVDETYRTIPDRNHRAIGGMSRGAGWAFHMGLTRWDLFGAVGLHSLAVFQGDASRIANWLADIPPSSRPRLFMDVGDNDQELAMAKLIEAQFTQYGISHEWRLYSGAHTEEYWSAHVQEYIRWYAEGWNSP
jgi:enterochelin esterase-like enzyme